MLLLAWITFLFLIGESAQETEPPPTLYDVYILNEPPSNDPMGDTDISTREVEGIFKQNRNVVQERYQLERRLADEGKTIKRTDKTPDLSLIRRTRTDPFVHDLESKQLPFSRVTTTLIERHNLSEKDVAEKLPEQPLAGQHSKEAIDNCTASRQRRNCDVNSVYRTADGTCNNLRNVTWGSVYACYRRLLEPNYIGVSGFRQSVLGGPLPSPRVLSLNIHNNLNRPTNTVNHMYSFFGQLLHLDISQTPISITVDNEAISCCPVSEDSHPQCAPITIRQNDPFYSQFGTTCLNFVRSAVCPTCRLGPRQQLNQITAFIDASFVYGNSVNETNNIRTMDGTGRLRTQKSSFGDLLPPSPDPTNDQCSFPDKNEICFQAGDSRVNQHTTLTCLQTIFLREHNRIADDLRRLNRHWDGERIFQETRKIVGAEMQAIVYKEYLPITLGPERMAFFKLYISDNGYTNYKSDINPTIYNEFSGAAFRFGHSLVNSVISQSPTNRTNGPRLLRNSFFQPFELRTGLLDPLLSGVTRSPSQFFDRHLVPDLTNYLYRVRGAPAGLDLASINIQRGRDHGLPTYKQMVNFCFDNANNIQQFRDLVYNNIMSRENVQLLQKNYRHVDDIDLWTGIVCESPNPSAIIGPTASCIIGLQFYGLKYGDRFYFEHRDQVPSFSFKQLQQLRQTSLSKILCLNSDIKQLPFNAMLFNTRNNPNIKCSDVRGIDLSYWKE